MVSNALCSSCLHCTSITEGKKWDYINMTENIWKNLSVNPVKNSKQKEMT